MRCRRFKVGERTWRGASGGLPGFRGTSLTNIYFRFRRARRRINSASDEPLEIQADHTRGSIVPHE